MKIYGDGLNMAEKKVPRHLLQLPGNHGSGRRSSGIRGGGGLAGDHWAIEWSDFFNFFDRTEDGT